MNTLKLKELMEEKNITQTKLAEVAGVSEAFISYVIKGFKNPSLDVMKRIANYLDTTIDELVN